PWSRPRRRPGLRRRRCARPARRIRGRAPRRRAAARSEPRSPSLLLAGFKIGTLIHRNACDLYALRRRLRDLTNAPVFVVGRREILPPVRAARLLPQRG